MKGVTQPDATNGVKKKVCKEIPFIHRCKSGCKG